MHDSMWTRVWIPIGGGLFVVALGVSALAVPQLRLLHLLQAFIYVVVVILARRNNVFAFGAGFTIAVVWNCLEIFGAHLMQAGAVMFWSFLRTGHVEHLETMMVPSAGSGISFSSLLAWPLFNQRTDNRKWWRFLRKLFGARVFRRDCRCRPAPLGSYFGIRIVMRGNVCMFGLEFGVSWAAYAQMAQ